LNIYYPAIVNMFRVDDVLYSMPATFSDVVLYYNKDLFDAAGLEYPQRDWTMEDMKTAAMALTQDTNGDGKIDQWGYSFPWWPLLLEMYNATIWNEDATACTLNSPQGIKAIQTVVDGRYVDKYAPDADQLAEQGEWDMFIAGKLAMYPTGPWAVQPFNDSITGFTYDIAHMPAGDKLRMFMQTHMPCLLLPRIKKQPGSSSNMRQALRAQSCARLENTKFLQ
jgi:multiple sugar transport system substrate-binding protein